MIDILQTADGDIDISTGDLQFCDEYRATEQHKADILAASKGDFSESPLTGVGLVDYVNAENNGLIFRDISQQMQQDGIKVTQIGMDENGDFIIDGGYQR